MECAVLIIGNAQGLLQHFGNLMRRRLALRLAEGRLYLAGVCSNTLDRLSVCNQRSLALCLLKCLFVMLGVLAGAL
jgi:hypothetical protein